MKYKVAFLISHPIQYYIPLYREFSNCPGIKLTVYYCWNFGVKETLDPEFGKKIKWDIPLLKGYKFNFLNNFSLKPSSGFWGQVNFGIIKELIYNKYNVILIFGWNSFTNWLAFLTAFILRIPIVLRGENPLNQELLKSKWKVRVKKIILGNLFRRISYFLYIGEENKKFYKYYDVPNSKLIFAPYAVDNDRLMEAARELKDKKKELKMKLNIDESESIILFVGKLIDKKRPMDLLRSYHRLLSDNQQLGIMASLFFVGDGALRPELEKYAKENKLNNVHFVGFKNQTELPEYYKMADLFILPSGDGETWGLVVNEAMCFGLPVIVSDRVGCGPDLIKDGENGYIFPVGDIDELAKKMEIISDGGELKKFGKKSYEIIGKYSYENDIQGILRSLK